MGLILRDCPSLNRNYSRINMHACAICKRNERLDGYIVYFVS